MADSLTAAAAEEAAAWKAAEERRKALGEKVGAAITSAFAAGFDMPPGEEVRVKIICGPTLLLTAEGVKQGRLDDIPL